VRIGLHTGEVELKDDDIGGIAVNIAARIAGIAGPGPSCQAQLGISLRDPGCGLKIEAVTPSRACRKTGRLCAALHGI
jgi:hypothetical protein